MREMVVLNLVINPRKKLTVTGYTLNVRQSQISGERDGRFKSGDKPPEKLTVTGLTLNVRQSQISDERDGRFKSGNKPPKKTDSNWLHVKCTAITDQW